MVEKNSRSGGLAGFAVFAVFAVSSALQHEPLVSLICHTLPAFSRNKNF